MLLAGRPVAQFYDDVVGALDELGVHVQLSTLPSEIEAPVRFEDDLVDRDYDPDAVRRWWQAMLSTERVITRYRSPFHGKSSPVLFYWGGFDLDHSRFSGRNLTPPTSGPTREFGEDQENFAVGFWPGSTQSPEPVLYAYPSPAPEGLAQARIAPPQSRWEPAVGEFLLPYEQARQAPSPDDVVAEFFRSIDDVSANLAAWNRAGLEGHTPRD